VYEGLGDEALKVELGGYRGPALQALLKAGVKVEDEIRITGDGLTYEGILVPRSEYGDEEHVVIKLRNGYNIGVRVTASTMVERLGAGAKLTFKPPRIREAGKDLPRVSILSTGGTIASRVDYRTGAVTPAFSASDLYSVVPELADIAVIDTEVLFSIFSEDMTPRHWTKVAEAAAKHIEAGVDGLVVAHGTDTMGYTAAALSFALQNLPVPLILVGAQRSPDRPSSDAALNLVGAVKAAAQAPFAEVAVAMHAETSDEAVALHRGTKVRKCHTSRRDTFKSINADLIALVKPDVLPMLTQGYRSRDPERSLQLKPKFDEKVVLVKHYPGFNPDIIEGFVDLGYHGLILEGTGLGHVASGCLKALKHAYDRGVYVGMTSQCLWGRVDMYVYYTGRDLMAYGVVPLEDMLPETALVKLMWVLGQTEDYGEVKRLMLTNIAGEFSPRTSYRWVS